MVTNPVAGTWTVLVNGFIVHEEGGGSRHKGREGPEGRVHAQGDRGRRSAADSKVAAKRAARVVSSARFRSRPPHFRKEASEPTDVAAPSRSRSSRRLAALLSAIVGAVLLRPSAPSAQRGAVPDGVTARAVAAAQAFLGDPEQPAACAHRARADASGAPDLVEPSDRRRHAGRRDRQERRQARRAERRTAARDARARRGRAEPDRLSEDARHRDGRRSPGADERADAARGERGALRTRPSTTPPSSAHRRPRAPGCCSSADTIWRST